MARRAWDSEAALTVSNFDEDSAVWENQYLGEYAVNNGQQPQHMVVWV
jgi:hypothetical protein